jgi:hypothetical protein
MISMTYAVVSLLYGSGPSTVGGEVAQMSVNTVQRCAKRPLSHVGEKVLEFLPSLADFYASRAVGVKFFVFGIIASLTHAPPRNPSWRQGHTMPCDGNTVAFTSETSTRCYAANLKCVATRFFQFSTIALAYPAQIFGLRFGQTKNCQIAETLAGKFVGRHHSHNIAYEKA